MSLYIHVLSGEKFGLKYRISGGIRIGRSRGDIKIPDPKISAIHARIEVSPLGGFILVDEGSAHKIRSGHRVFQELPLSEGVRFELGRTMFEVLEVEDAAQLDQKQPAVDSESLNRLIKALSILRTRNIPQRAVQSFHRPVGLTFTEGIELGRKLTLFYGPRVFGAHSLDIELIDPQCPENAFEIIPDGQAVRIKSSLPGFVLLNNQEIESALLRAGDSIQIGDSLIRVEM